MEHIFFLFSNLAFKPWHETSICLFHKQNVKKQRGQWDHSSSLTCIRSHSQVVAKSGPLSNTFSNWCLLSVGRLKPRENTALANEITVAGWWWERKVTNSPSPSCPELEVTGTKKERISWLEKRFFKCRPGRPFQEVRDAKAMFIVMLTWYLTFSS